MSEPQPIKNRHQIYYAENRQKVRERQRRYHLPNRDAMRERPRASPDLMRAIREVFSMPASIWIGRRTPIEGFCFALHQDDSARSRRRQYSP
jgi:hypothetical protein